MKPKAEEKLEPLNLSKRQVAQLAGVGVRTVERLTARGALRAFRPAGLRCVRYARGEVLDWIERGCPVPAPKRRRC